MKKIILLIGLVLLYTTFVYSYSLGDSCSSDSTDYIYYNESMPTTLNIQYDFTDCSNCTIHLILDGGSTGWSSNMQIYEDQSSQFFVGDQGGSSNWRHYYLGGAWEDTLINKVSIVNYTAYHNITGGDHVLMTVSNPSGSFKRLDSDSIPATFQSVKTQSSGSFGDGGWALFVYDGAFCPPAVSPPPNNFTITAKTFYFNDTILNFNVTVNGVNYTTDNGSITTGIYTNETNPYNVSVSAPNHLNKEYLNYNVSNSLEAYLNFSYYKINVTAKDFFSNASVENFTITYNTIDYTAIGNNLILNVTKNQNATFLIDSFGYAFSNTTIYANDWLTSYEFELYPTNSINIYIRDESTNTLITENVSMLFSSVSGDFTNYTSTGTFFIESLDVNEYDITFSSTNYQNRIYTVNVGNRSHQNLNVYLTKSTDTTIFIIKDKDSASLLEGVQSTMYRTINGSWQPVETKNSDITGRVQFTYEKGIQYRFYMTLNNYEDLIFYLNPILFDEYNIGLQSLVSDNSSPDYIDLSILYTKQFETGSNPFNFLIQSPDGVLTNSGYNLTYKNISVLNSGTNAIGEQLSSTLNITNPGAFDTVRLDYYYETSSSDGNREFTVYFPIKIEYYNNNTMMANQDDTYGLGLLDRVLIVMVIGILILGMASLVGKAIPGFILTLLIWGYLVSIGFIEWWIIAISIFAGLLLIGRESQ